MGLDLPLLDKLQLKRGDELHFTGSPADLNRVQSKIGYKITAAAVTDFIFFGIGMLIGMLLGLIQFKIWGIPISIGSGGGCLLSGLFFGWLRSVHPNFAALADRRLELSCATSVSPCLSASSASPPARKRWSPSSSTA